MPVTSDLYDYLDLWDVDYKRLPADEPSSNDVEDAGGSAQFVSTCLVRLDGRYALVVYPANRCLDLQRMLAATGCQTVEYVSEMEARALFPDCDPAAIPPVCVPQEISILADRLLFDMETIVFRARRHDDVVSMSTKDLRRIAHPKHGQFSTRPSDDVEALHRS